MPFTLFKRISDRLQAPQYGWPRLTRARMAEIVAAVERDGKWETHDEWRISTVTSTRIERTGQPAWRAYHVRVECDYVLEADCPTIERAADIAHMYQALVIQVWKQHGWPRWK